MYNIWIIETAEHDYQAVREMDLSASIQETLINNDHRNIKLKAQILSSNNIPEDKVQEVIKQLKSGIRTEKIIRIS